MANIKKHLDNIKGALFGKDVRSSIHDGIDAINKEVESTTNRQEHLEDTFDQLVINSGNSNAEIVDARVGENGKSYAKLGDRLDEVDSQLEHKATEFDTVEDMKNYNCNKNDKVRTFGYYSADDGGGAKYIIVENGVDDGGSYIRLNNGLYAKLVHNGVIYARQFGVKLDDETDDTNALNKFFKLCGEAKLIIDNGIAVVTDTIFVKGKWRKDSVNDYDNSLTKIVFDNASIKYEGIENGCSVMFYNHFSSYIEGLAIARTSVNNYVDLSFVWNTKFANFDIPNLCFNKNPNIITPALSEKSIHTNTFDRGYVYGGKLFMDSTGTYINSINFNNVNLFSNKSTECVELTGTGFQNIVFNCCDLSYATESVLKINNKTTSLGSISFNSCYFDSAIPLILDGDTKGFKINNINNMESCEISASRSIIFTEDYLRSMDLNSISASGNYLPSSHLNLCKNGDLYHTDTLSGSWFTNDELTHTTSFVSSSSNINGNGLRISMISDKTIYLYGVQAPYTSIYTAGIRLKKISGSGTMKLGFNNKYNDYDLSLIPDGKEIIISNNTYTKTSIQQGTTLGASLSIKSTDLIFEIYEMFFLPGTMIHLNSPMSPNASFRNKSGYTINRPVIKDIGGMYYDTSINKPIWWNGSVWKDSTGATV